MITLGFDIGLTGAVCALGRNDIRVFDLPTCMLGSTKVIDGRALILLVRELVPPGEVAIGVLEDVRPRPMGNAGAHGNTMHSQGSLMRSRGQVETALQIARIRIEAIQPQAWKREFGLLKTEKDEARVKAVEQWPALAADLSLKKHGNRADAVWIARFGQMRFA